MIVELSVENLAIIESAQLTFGPGFTVLTGETGAGKSLLIDAIELALGERADTELVRSGARRALVNVVMDLSAQPGLIDKCAEFGVPVEDGLLYVQREVFAEGRSQCRVGGKLIPVSALRQLGAFLVDLHGQHDHQSLLDPERHIEFLDSWIGEPAARMVAETADAHWTMEDAKRRLASLKSGLRDREQRLDLLRYQLNEIELADPKPGESEEAEAAVQRLGHIEKLSLAASSALEGVADGETSALDALASAIKSIEGVVRFDATLEDIASPLREGLYRIQEAAHALRGYTEALESDPQLLDDLQSRLELLKRLRRKYGDDEAQVVEFAQKCREELAELEDVAANEGELEESLAVASNRYLKTALRLRALRTERAEGFSKLVQEQLRDLAMERALFSAEFGDRPADATGIDAVEFFFSANAGEPSRPLSKIASGGEVSRVMLAIKTALAGKAGVPTLIFDEVDSGLGGRAAATMARKLEELAANYQVLVISHLPQIAGRATTHYRIEKTEIQGRVVTGVRRLSHDERVEEIARMLAGEQVTDSALAHAREMLVGG